MAQFTNQAQLSYNGMTVSSNIAVGEIVETLTVTKTAVPSNYSGRDRITYLINIINSGTTDLPCISLTDDLGAYTFNNTTLVPLTYTSGTARYFTNGVLQPVPTVTSESPLTITCLTVPAGGNVLVVYETTTNQFADPSVGGTITNTATVTGNGITTTTASATVTSTDDPELTITKSISPVPVAENDVLTYTFIIQNTGNSEAIATDGVVVSDQFDPILSNLSVTFNGTPWTVGNQYNYQQTSGLFTSNSGQITVPAATFTRDPVTGAHVITPGIATLVISGTV